MERTAMQNHIDWIKTTLEISKDEAPILVNCLELCLKNAESKLEEEKNQIIYTYKSGFLSGIYNNEMTAEQYYNETFKSE